MDTPARWERRVVEGGAVFAPAGAPTGRLRGRGRQGGLAQAQQPGPRFSLPSGAYFGTVANAYLVHAMVPSDTTFGFADFVTSLGFFTILSCIVCVRISAHYHREHKDEVFSRQIDKASLAVNGLGYIAVNTALVLSAYY